MPEPTTEALPLLLRLPDYDLLSQDTPVPAGYVLGHIPSSECQRVATLMAKAFPGGPWDRDRVARELSAAAGVEQIYVVTYNCEIVASAAARRFSDFPGSGYVHLVAVDPAHRGQRLGEIVTGAVAAFFSSSDLRDVVLETGDENLRAVKTYLRVGFVPVYRHHDDPLRWSKVLRALLLRQRDAPPPGPSQAPAPQA